MVRFCHADKRRKSPTVLHSFSGTQYGKQTLTTAQVNFSQPDSDTLKIDGVEDHKSVFDGADGTVYQNVQQFIDEGNYSSGDNHTMRDPHYVEDRGHKYLVFEANTGTKPATKEKTPIQQSLLRGQQEVL